MAADNRVGQYSAVAQYLAAWKPSWLPDDEALRVASYRFYDILYWNDTGEIKLTIRGDEANPVYIPSARRIVNTFARYVMRACKLRVQAATPDLRDEAKAAFDKLFIREGFWTKLHTEKKYGSARGDMVFMLVADPSKPEGTRISITTVNPGTFFAIPNPEKPSERWGASIMEEVTIDNKIYIKVQTWLKSTHPGHPNYNPQAVLSALPPIAYSSIIYETDNFKDPAKRKTFRVDRQLELLPGITSLPLYHIRANATLDDVYGISDLRGIERIFLAINQTATDQDVAIAMAGLGLYASDSSPVDDEGSPSDWVLGPKRVVEVPEGGKFERVSGVVSVEPTIEHMEWIQQQAESLFGINDIALGDAEVAVAESGIALALRMGPLLDNTEPRDREHLDVLNQMMFDLQTQWFPVYERIQFGDPTTTTIDIVPGDKLPQDRAARIEELNTLYTNGLVSKQWVWRELIEMGEDIDPATMMAELEEGGGFEGDPTGDRLAEEAEPGDVTDDGGPE